MKSKMLLILFILNMGCMSKNDKNKDNEDFQSDNSFYTINFTDMLKKQQEILISDIADSIKYIALETSPSSLLGSINDAKFTKDYFFIYHNGTTSLLSQFDKNGHFIRNIGRIGRGPEEYLGIRAFSIDEENKLIFIHLNFKNKILIYSFDGEYVKSINIDREYTEIVWNRDSLFMCFREPTIGNEEYVFTEINGNGDILQGVSNYCFWENKLTPIVSVRLRNRSIFYRFDNHLHFKGWYNDTIYSYDNNKIIPKFLVDMGKYKLPDELRFERQIEVFPSEYYWYCVNETSGYVFIHFAPFPSPDEKMSLNGGYLCYNKKTKTGNTLKNENGKIGFVNDLDGGPEFIPEYTNDSLAFHFIEAADIKKYLATDKSLEPTLKYPKQKDMLIKQLNGLNEADNPMIMVVKLK